MDRLTEFVDGLLPDEVEKLKRDNDGLRDIVKKEYEIAKDEERCDTCENADIYGTEEPCFSCRCNGKWKWQHAEKAEELGVEL